MSSADTGDDTVVSKRRWAADETVVSARRQVTEDTVVSRRDRAGPARAEIAVPNSERGGASRQAYEPSADALRSPAPVRAAPPVLIPRRARVPGSGQRPGGESSDPASPERARARARLVFWLLGGCAVAAATAAGLLALLVPS